MSAWIVSKAHVDAMVTAALELGNGFGEPLSIYLPDGPRHVKVTADTADEIGQMLVDECVASVSHRYPDDDVDAGELPGPVDTYYLRPYTFERTRTLTDAEIAKAVSCYAYQSCEHPEWEASAASRLCDAIQARLLARLPGYDQAPWGLELDDVGYLALRDS